MIRKLLVGVVAISVSLAAPALGVARADCSGRWILDEEHKRTETPNENS